MGGWRRSRRALTVRVVFCRRHRRRGVNGQADAVQSSARVVRGRVRRADAGSHRYRWRSRLRGSCMAPRRLVTRHSCPLLGGCWRDGRLVLDPTVLEFAVGPDGITGYLTSFDG